MDWSRTSLGPRDQWSASLRIAASFVETAKTPAWLWWGPQAITLANDACAALCAGTDVQGVPAAALSGEPWVTVRGRDDSENLRIVLDRGAGPEETYFTLITAVVDSDGGQPAGRIGRLVETTSQVLRRRRHDALYQMLRATVAETTVDGTCRAAAAALAANHADLPFVAIYHVDAVARVARLAGAAGLPDGSPATPEVIDLVEAAPTGWPLGRIFANGLGEIVTQLDRLGLPTGPDQPSRAVALPIQAGDRTLGFLCAGLGPQRPLNPELRGYLDLVLRDLGAAISTAYDREAAARRTRALVELDGKKTKFFVDVTHEFRTPLTLLTVAIEDALIDVKNDMQRDRLRMAHHNSQRLSRLVNNLLDFAHVEASQVRASYAPTDLAQLTIDIASSFESLCARAGIRLIIDCPPVGEPVYVDPQMWEKIVLNLVSNAFKYTLFGKIEVTLRKHDHAVELAVADTGCGIAAEHVPHVFDRFYRIRDTRGRSAEGTGVGLAMVRELARWHGGDVTVDSRVGAGSLFRVTVRRGTAHLQTDQIDPSHVLISRVTRAVFTEDAGAWLGDELADRVPAGPLGTRPRILWADDNADMRTYVRRLLATEFEVVAVPDGKAALDAIRSKPFDLVLADVMMPELDGLALVEALRADPRDRATPILLVSSRSGDDALVEALERGADEYLVKPFTPRRLIAAVRSHLALSRMRRRDDASS